jgi:hypothetical protein
MEHVMSLIEKQDEAAGRDEPGFLPTASQWRLPM